MNKDKYKRDMFVIILLLIYSPLVFTLFQYRFCMSIVTDTHKWSDIYFIEVAADAMDIHRGEERKKSI